MHLLSPISLMLSPLCFLIHCLTILHINVVSEHITQSTNISQTIKFKCLERSDLNCFPFDQCNNGNTSLVSHCPRGSLSFQNYKLRWHLWRKLSIYHHHLYTDYGQYKSVTVESNSELIEANAIDKEMSSESYLLSGNQDKCLLHKEHFLKICKYKRVSNIINHQFPLKNNIDNNINACDDNYQEKFRFSRRSLLEAPSEINREDNDNEYDYGDGINDDIDEVVDDTIIKRNNPVVFSRKRELYYDVYDTEAVKGRGSLGIFKPTLTTFITFVVVIFTQILCY